MMGKIVLYKKDYGIMQQVNRITHTPDDYYPIIGENFVEYPSFK